MNPNTIHKLISASLFASLTLAVAQPTHATSASQDLGCKTVFRDNFNRAQLKPGWTYTDPNADVTLSLQARHGFLRLSTLATGDNNLAGTSLNGARLLRPLSSDDYVVETTISTTPTNDYHGGGLVVWVDSTRFLRLERGLGLFGPGVIFAAQDGENFRLDGGFLTTYATTLKLRIVRAGDHFLAFMREPNSKWKLVGSYTLDWSSQQQVGFDLITEFGPPQTTVDYDSFAVSTCGETTPLESPMALEE